MSHTVTQVTSARERQLLAEIASEHPGETWTCACGNKRCSWGCGEAWVPNADVWNG